MVTREKTIEFVFTQNTSNLASNTRFDFGAQTLYLPENASAAVTFKDVAIEVTARDNATAEASITSWLVGIKLGAVAFNDVTVGDTITTNSALSTAFLFTRTSGLAAYFQANFGAGGTQTCQVGFRTVGMAMINITAKLFITFEYDDSATTQVKTVKIPLDSQLGKLTNTLTQIGTNQVPKLTGSGGLIQEASPVIRDLWFQIETCEGEEAPSSTTTDFQLGLSLDAEAEALDGSHEAQISAETWYRRIWKRTDMDPTAVHAFKARSTVTNRFTSLAIVLCVTFEYDEAATTRVTNSVRMLLPVDGGLNGGTAAGDRSRAQLKFQIQEPGVVTLLQSGVGAWFNGLLTVNLACGSQSSRAYALLPDTTEATISRGTVPLTHRIDSGALAGSAGVTLARGENTLTCDWYRNDTTAAGVSAEPMIVAFINYASDKAPAGSGVHNHTVSWWIGSGAVSTGAVQEHAAVAPVINAASYWVTAAGLVCNSMVNTAGATGAVGHRNSVAVAIERLTGEGPGDGWARAVQPYHQSLTLAPNLNVVGNDVTGLFAQYPGDPDVGKMALETARKYRTQHTVNHWDGLRMDVTYHSIARVVTGAVRRAPGDGSGIAVKIHDVATGRWIGTATTALGGGFTLTWYDNVGEVFGEAVRGSQAGRSNNGVAV